MMPSTTSDNTKIARIEIYHPINVPGRNAEITLEVLAGRKERKESNFFPLFFIGSKKNGKNLSPIQTDLELVREFQNLFKGSPYNGS